jgi:hypothetical protein
MEDFIPDPEGTGRSEPPKFVLTTFVPDERFTPQEIACIVALEATTDGLACLRRDDRAERIGIMRSAIAKGYDLNRGRRFRPKINLFPLR